MQKRQSDFSTSPRLLWIALLALPVGAIGAVLAFALLRLIWLFTNLFYLHRLSVLPAAPTQSDLGWLTVFVPVVGGLVIGLMARFGSERIRGHGIPEAMEAILFGRSRMDPKIAVLKPLSSAISIGSGGPFGAEGPIIMTGGAVGSLIAQTIHMTANERKTLLVAGAAAGMSATFATPIAAVLLAVELLLFEWRPRSFVPVAVASATAALLRPFFLGAGPIFPVAAHATLPASVLLGAVPVGIGAGILAILLTLAVYGVEDLFAHLPVHWMWWPALGGLVVGIGGLIEPRVLGVGYDTIEELLTGHYVVHALVVLLVVKGVIWAIALGSGTSGGVLAPLLIMGGALGAIFAPLLPSGDRTLWPLVAMAAALGGTMRSPLTATLFALELTHDVEALPVLLIATVVAHGFTVLTMRRSILTEKVARRGYHLNREYAVDPLENLAVRDAMAAPVDVIPASTSARDLLGPKFFGGRHKHQGYPVVDADDRLVGLITRGDVLEHWPDLEAGEGAIVAFDLIRRPPLVAYTWEPCRVAAERMAQNDVGRLPVVSAENPTKVLGMITRSDLLKPRLHRLVEESTRERNLGIGAARPWPNARE